MNSDQPTNSDPCAANPSDCLQAVEELYGYLDGELTSEKRNSISQHLDDCSNCLGAYDFHSELKRLVSEKCRAELPESLRSRVFDALRALDT